MSHQRLTRHAPRVSVLLYLSLPPPPLCLSLSLSFPRVSVLSSLPPSLSFSLIPCAVLSLSLSSPPPPCVCTAVLCSLAVFT